jgi:hypothetical protein
MGLKKKCVLAFVRTSQWDRGMSWTSAPCQKAFHALWRETLPRLVLLIVLSCFKKLNGYPLAWNHFLQLTHRVCILFEENVSIPTDEVVPGSRWIDFPSQICWTGQIVKLTKTDTIKALSFIQINFNPHPRRTFGIEAVLVP